MFFNGSPTFENYSGFIGYETDFNLDDSDSNYENEDQEIIKCGDIFILERGKFVFCCYFCDIKFKGIKGFLRHIDNTHIHDYSKVDHWLDSEDDFETKSDSGIREKVLETIKGEPDIDYFEDQFSNREEFAGDENNDEAEGENKPSEIPNIRAEHLEATQETTAVPEIIAKQSEDSKDIFIVTEPIKPEKIHNKVKTVRKSTPRKVKDPLSCKFCKKQCHNVRERRYHETTDHAEDKPFRCMDCTKCFRRQSQLNDHKTIHTGERPYPCPHCPSRFKIQANLLVHVRSHLGIKKYKCPDCEKAFTSNALLRVHIRSHTGERPYKCDQCSKGFTTASKLSVHKNYHTKTKPFPCDICKKNFYTSNQLKTHKAYHSDEKPFQCPTCPSAFQTKTGLQSHVKIHSNVKEYICKVCKKRFAQNAGLYTHMKLHGFNLKPKDEPQDTK